MKVRFKKINKNAIAPFQKHATDAGWDLSVLEYSIKGDTVSYDSGLAVEIPVGYVGLLFPRSSIANTALFMSNSVGVIDSDYRGTIKAKFNLLDNDGDIYDYGDRFCQLIIMPFPQIEWELSDELSDTERGVGGYGSTNI